jgi:hypothetical protein
VTLCKSKSGETQPGETGLKPKYPNCKDVKRMTENLADLLKTIVKIILNHSDQLKRLEEGELAEDIEDASLMKQVTSLLAQLQIHQSAEPGPSDPM